MPRVLRTDTETDSRAAALKGEEMKYDIVANAEIVNRAKIAGRYVAATGRLYVVSAELTKWTTTRGLDLRSLLHEWEQSGMYIKGVGGKPMLKKISAGIHKNTLPEMKARVYTFSLAHMAAKYDLPDGTEAEGNVVAITQAMSMRSAGIPPEQRIGDSDAEEISGSSE
jgi:hypothetical protein